MARKKKAETLPAVREELALPVARGQTPFDLLNPQTMAQAMETAEFIAQATTLPDHYRGKPADVLIALHRARSLGVDVFALMEQAYMVRGKMGVQAQLVIGLVNASSKFEGDLKWELSGEGDHMQCFAWATRVSDGKRLNGPIVSIGMAKKNGWYNKDGSKWPVLPEMMLQYRSATFFSRLHCPEFTLGLKTADELEDEFGDDAKKNPKKLFSRPGKAVRAEATEIPSEAPTEPENQSEPITDKGAESKPEPQEGQDTAASDPKPGEAEPSGDGAMTEQDRVFSGLLDIRTALLERYAVKMAIFNAFLRFKKVLRKVESLDTLTDNRLLECQSPLEYAYNSPDEFNRAMLKWDGQRKKPV